MWFSFFPACISEIINIFPPCLVNYQCFFMMNLYHQRDYNFYYSSMAPVHNGPWAPHKPLLPSVEIEFLEHVKFRADISFNIRREKSGDISLLCMIKKSFITWINWHANWFPALNSGYHVFRKQPLAEFKMRNQRRKNSHAHLPQRDHHHFWNLNTFINTSR